MLRPEGRHLEVALEGIDHLIHHPREIYLDNGSGTLTSLEIVDAEGTKQIVKLKDPLAIPRPVA